MKKIAALILSVVFASSAFGASAPTQRYLVATRAALAADRIGTLIRDIEPTPQPQNRNVVTFQSVNGFAADLTAGEAAALAQSAGVRYVEPVVERHAFDLVAPKTGNSDAINPFAQTVPFGIDLVHARDVWPVTRGQGINVVVADTGVDYTHPDLVAVYAGGYNTFNTAIPPMDDNDHGTHVSGTIAAQDNNFGVVGVAPGVKLWAVKVLDSTGSGSSARMITAIDWTINQKNALGGNWVMNFSLGSTMPSSLEQEAFARAISAGILICAASGNESTATVPAPLDYPAAYPDVMAIGAVDSTRAIASFSNEGSGLAVVAPGVSVLSTVPVGKGTAAGVSSSAGSFVANEIELSKRGTVTAGFVDCSLGNPGDFPAGVAGRIAVIKRGSISFNAKAHNAVSAGAMAIIIYNNDGSSLNFTLKNDADPGASTFNWPVTVALSLVDGQKLLANGSGQITVTDQADDYDVFSGTSMATPHAVGVAALVWSAAPGDSAAQIRQAMTSTADDLGATGFDMVFGNGLLDALGAAKAVAPSKFGNSGTPAPAAGKSRAVRHH